MKPVNDRGHCESG